MRRRPLQPEEVPDLEAMGADLRRHRLDSGVTQQSLADRVGMNRVSISNIERGQVRTRRSTLTDLANALRASDGTVDHWCELAGPALAAESEYADRIARRRARRQRRRSSVPTQIDASEMILHRALLLKRVDMSTEEGLRMAERILDLWANVPHADAVVAVDRTGGSRNLS